MDFYVGQKVVCVNARVFDNERDCEWAVGEALTEGQVYTVRSAHLFEGFPALHLFEISRAAVSQRLYGDAVGYSPTRFRPLVERKTSIEIFQRLLLPSEKEKELETMTGNPNL